MNNHYFVFYVPCSDEEEEEEKKIRNPFSIFIDWMKMIHDECVCVMLATHYLFRITIWEIENILKIRYKAKGHNESVYGWWSS